MCLCEHKVGFIHRVIFNNITLLKSVWSRIYKNISLVWFYMHFSTGKCSAPVMTSMEFWVSVESFRN